MEEIYINREKKKKPKNSREWNILYILAPYTRENQKKKKKYPGGIMNGTGQPYID